MSELVNTLKQLLELKKPIDEIKTELSHYGWDREEELVQFTSTHAISVLERFKKGELSLIDVEEWANAVESRDDIGFEDSKEDLLKQLIFELANPDITNQITIESAIDWIRKLL
ncbi:MAG: hypothetical protein HY808_03545 [Nitrospirae bacterium]|nr:hypothetical protein [Nitrospirota bacterium]